MKELGLKLIIVNGKKIRIVNFFAYDYKILLKVNGLCAASSNHSCLWCLVKKENFHLAGYKITYE